MGRDLRVSWVFAFICSGMARPVTYAMDRCRYVVAWRSSVAADDLFRVCPVALRPGTNCWIDGMSSCAGRRASRWSHSARPLACMPGWWCGQARHPGDRGSHRPSFGIGGIVRIVRHDHGLGTKILKRYNALVLPTAGRRFSDYAVLRHKGRRSGRTYLTPVDAYQFGDGS